MSNDPLRIHLDKLMELVKGLGLDPVDPKDLRSVHIDPSGVTVVRSRLDEAGRCIVVGDEIATETVTIRIDR